MGAHNASGDLVFCGAVSSGLSRKARTALHARLSEIEAPHSPFTDMPSSVGVRWVQPSLIAVIDYREFNGRFRHPAFKGLLHADPTIVPLERIAQARRVYTWLDSNHNRLVVGNSSSEPVYAVVVHYV